MIDDDDDDDDDDDGDDAIGYALWMGVGGWITVIAMILTELMTGIWVGSGNVAAGIAFAKA